MNKKAHDGRRGAAGVPGERPTKRQAEVELLRRVEHLKRQNARLTAACEGAFRRGREFFGKARHWRDLAGAERKERRRLQGVARRAFSENDSDRRKMSHQLNNRILQTLVGINIRLATLKLLSEAGHPNLARGIGRTQRLLEKSATAVTRYSRRLHPGLLDEAGLIPALEACARDISSRTGLSIRMSRMSEPRGLTGEKRFALYHIAEAALEAARRRHAKRACVRIGTRSEVVTLTIVDDAQPADFGSPEAKESGRLAAAREALEIAGGSLSAYPASSLDAELPVLRPFAAAVGAA